MSYLSDGDIEEIRPANISAASALTLISGKSRSQVCCAYCGGYSGADGMRQCRGCGAPSSGPIAARSNQGYQAAADWLHREQARLALDTKQQRDRFEYLMMLMRGIY